MSDKYNKDEPSVLQKIQNKTGCLFLVIGIAMLAFVLTDLTSNNGILFGGGNQNSVGTIYGEQIQSKEFDALYQDIKLGAQQRNPGLQITTEVDEQFKQQAWNQIVNERVKGSQFKELGIGIGEDELIDITVGNNTHPQIKQSFQNPETQQFDKERFITFLNVDVEQDPKQKQAWNDFQEQFEKIVIEEKYNALVESSFYTTDLEARVQYELENITRNASIVNVPYATIQDSLVSVSDSEIKDYVKRHRGEYEQEASRDIEYISFDVVPSAKDSSDMNQWIASQVENFANTTDDSAFVMLNSSETPFTGEFVARGSFLPKIEDRLFNAPIGEVVGPFTQDGLYSLYKVVEEGTDSLPSVRVSHIIVPIVGNNEEEAEKKANEIRSKIASGATTFEDEAKTNRDGTGPSGGDLGYIRTSNYQVPQELIDKMMLSGQGRLVTVKSRTGVHIAKATSPVSRKTIKVATLSRKLIPSTTTDGEFYTKAGEFKTQIGGELSFEELAEKFGLTKRIALDINEDERRVTGINNGNIVAYWLFNDDTEVGDVSDILTIGNRYVIARLTKIKEEGLPKVEDVRDQVEPFVRNEKKAEMIMPNVEKALEETQDKNELAKKLETIVSEAPVANFTAASLPYIGKDEKVMGTIFGTEVGKMSKPVAGKNGVAVVLVNGLNKAEAEVDIESKKIELNSNNIQISRTTLNNALTEKAEVTDRRYRIYNRQ